MSIYDGAMKAAVVIPAYSHVDHRLERALLEAGLSWLPLHEHSDLPRARSLLIEQALLTQAERVILIDSDVVPTAGVLRALAEAEGVTPYQAVWGMYPLKQGDRWSVNPIDPVDADRALREGQSFPIRSGGLGLCAIHRESLERVGATLPTVVEESELSWRPFCVPFLRQLGGAPLEPAEYYPDDASLCVRLYDTGTALWCDPRLRAGHVVRSVLTALRDREPRD